MFTLEHKVKYIFTLTPFTFFVAKVWKETLAVFKPIYFGLYFPHSGTAWLIFQGKKSIFNALNC